MGRIILWGLAGLVAGPILTLALATAAIPVFGISQMEGAYAMGVVFTAMFAGGVLLLEQSDTSGYSIEHIMPQNEKIPEAWRVMLGEGWKGVRQTWLHRLGNLTLTGYNSTYSDKHDAGDTFQK